MRNTRKLLGVPYTGVAMLLSVGLWTGEGIAGPGDSGGQPQLGFSGAVAGQALHPSALPTATSAPSGSSTRSPKLRHPDEAAYDAAKAAAHAGHAAATRGSENAAPVPDGAPTVKTITNTNTASGASPSPDIPAKSGASFYGNGQCDGGAGCFFPSDMGMAAGSVIVEANNVMIRIFSKAGAVLAGPFSLHTWFGRPSTDFIFDPVVNYRAGKFVISAVDCPGGNCNNSLILASGAGAHPESTVHCNYAFSGNFGVGAGNFADYPKQGMNANRTIIATNTFNNSSQNFVQNLVTILTTSTIVPTAAGACPAAAVEQWFNFRDSGGNLLFTQVPMQDYDADGATGFQLWSANFGTSSGMNVWKRSTTTVNWTRYAMATNGYSIPPAAPQPGTSAKIDTNDDRLQGAVKRYGQVWLSHTSGLGGCGGSFPVTANTHIVRAASSDNPANAPVNNLDFFYIEGPSGGCGNWDFYGIAAPDGNGDMIFGFGRTSVAVCTGCTNQFVQLRAGGFHTWQGIGASVLIQPSTGPFIDASGRWGDYYSASIDTSQDYVWVAGELLQGNSFWTTGIGKAYWTPNPTAP